MIPGGVFGFIRVLLLLVKNQQAQLLQRGKDRRAGPQNDAGLACPDALPLGKAIRDPQAAVQHGDGIAKVGGKNRASSCGVSPISGTRDQGAAAFCQAAVDELQVDCRLACAGHAVEQRRMGRIVQQVGGQGVIRLLLGGRQGKVRRLRSGGKAGGRRDGLLAGLDQPQ